MMKAANTICSQEESQPPIIVEKLLQRDEIQMYWDQMSRYLEGEVILVTGGGGSIGSELCRQIARSNPKMLLILDIYENNAYDVQMELLQKYQSSVNVKILIGSIQDKKRMENVFSNYHPTIVFHSAAHKHVPLMEENPQEAIKNNVFGTLNVAECAHKYGCKKFVLISTDKAVNPTSVMGATKRMAEWIIQYMDSISETRYCAVRFGNVLNSNGSVIPLFRKQIESGGPVTVTHPDVTRYFMTISEAVSLVIKAADIMEGGEIYVLDMGEQIKIVDLAKALIYQYGLKPGIDIEIKYIGLRPGEKLHEELLISKDEVKVSDHFKIYIETKKKEDLDKFIKILESIRLNPIENSKEAIAFLKWIMPWYGDHND